MEHVIPICIANLLKSIEMQVQLFYPA